MSHFTQTIQEWYKKWTWVIETNQGEEQHTLMNEAHNMMLEMDRVLTETQDGNVNTELAKNAIEFAGYTHELERRLKEVMQERDYYRDESHKNYCKALQDIKHLAPGELD